MMAKPLAVPAFTATSALRYRDGTSQVWRDRVAVETPVAIALNGQDFAVMLTTPADLEDFARGFLLTEGLITRGSEHISVDVQDFATGIKLAVTIENTPHAILEARERVMAGRSGCGICGISSIEQVMRNLPALPDCAPLGAQAIVAASEAMASHQAINAETGAVHAAAFADRAGKILLAREDVGRHNALDKLIGALIRAQIDPLSGFALITSRCSMEMVQKAVIAGFPVLAAISAPTSLAIALAKSCRLSLVGFVRAGGFSVYTHQARVSVTQ